MAHEATKEDTMQASPMKLRDGSWGAKVRSADVKIGDTVTITTRAGKSWDATVSRVLWTGDGAAICATSRTSDSQSQSRPNYTAKCCGYPCPVTGIRCTPDHPCHDCL